METLYEMRVGNDLCNLVIQLVFIYNFPILSKCENVIEGQLPTWLGMLDCSFSLGVSPSWWVSFSTSGCEDSSASWVGVKDGADSEGQWLSLASFCSSFSCEEGNSEASVAGSSDCCLVCCSDPSVDDAFWVVFCFTSSRSEERRVVKKCVKTCRYGWSPYQ